MKLKFFLTISITGLLFLIGSFPACASTYNFYSITNTIAENVAIGEAQLSVDVTNEDVGSNQVLFTFWNSGPDACSIAEVYFDDGSLLSLSELYDKDNHGDPGVDFEEGANPSNLPNWDNAVPPFIATAAFSSQANHPAPKKGVNPGESLGILFNLQGGQDYDDVLAELANGDLRIGIHVTAFVLGEGESFINNPTPTPIPATVWMFGAGLVGLLGIRRKLANH